MSKSASLLAHLRDVLLMPAMVVVVIPYFLDKPTEPPTVYLQILGIISILAGFTIFIITVWLFKVIGKGTLAPWSVKRRLVIAGPYRYCRNPMITGVFFMLIGESIFFWSSTLITYALVFFVINTVYFILVEEPGLMEQFGSDYKEYKIHVPRWFPRLKPYSHL